MAADEETPQPLLSGPEKLTMAAGGIGAYVLGWWGAGVIDRWITRRVRQRAIRGFAATLATATAALDPDVPPEPARPGVYRCRSKSCGYHWYRDPAKTDEAHWLGPFKANGDMPIGPKWHTWGEVDGLWYDCTARLQRVHADMIGYLAEAKKDSDR